jgi:3-hydroxyisobutyrate dehydrogenase-like beta-hydroxyacid dehydrogenase
MSSKERIGFIGVGLMGHGMAKNILETATVSRSRTC